MEVLVIYVSTRGIKIVSSTLGIVIFRFKVVQLYNTFLRGWLLTLLSIVLFHRKQKYNLTYTVIDKDRYWSIKLDKHKSAFKCSLYSMCGVDPTEKMTRKLSRTSLIHVASESLSFFQWDIYKFSGRWRKSLWLSTVYILYINFGFMDL
jgi:hypothetical protein